MSVGTMIEDKARLAALAYQLILGWAPKSDEAALQFVGEFDNLAQLRARLFNKAEMTRNLAIMQVCELLYRPLEAEQRQHFAAFRKFRVATPDLEDAIRAAIGAFTDNYTRFHALRFADQLRTLVAIRRQMLPDRERVRVLDCGVMPISRMYHTVLPEIDLCTAEFPGKDKSRAAYGAHEHYEINLELEDLSTKFPDMRERKFDIILFCEIMEHLRADPVEILQDFKRILAPDGAIYLTTPNVMALGSVLALTSGVSAQAKYSKRNRVHEVGNIHVREYTMKELVASTASAGLAVKYRAIEEYFHPDGMLVDRFISARSLLTLVLAHP